MVISGEEVMGAGRCMWVGMDGGTPLGWDQKRWVGSDGWLLVVKVMKEFIGLSRICTGCCDALWRLWVNVYC